MRLCRLGVHRPGAEMIWNASYHVTRCVHCGIELLRIAGRWWRIPHGHRVRWSPGTPAGALVDRHPNPDSRPAWRRLPAHRAYTGRPDD